MSTKKNAQGEKRKGAWGCRKRVNKEGMRAKMEQRREEVRRGNVRQVRGEGREDTPKKRSKIGN